MQHTRGKASMALGWGEPHDKQGMCPNYNKQAMHSPLAPKHPPNHGTGLILQQTLLFSQKC